MVFILATFYKERHLWASMTCPRGEWKWEWDGYDSGTISGQVVTMAVSADWCLVIMVTVIVFQQSLFSFLSRPLLAVILRLSAVAIFHHWLPFIGQLPTQQRTGERWLLSLSFLLFAILYIQCVSPCANWDSLIYPLENHLSRGLIWLHLPQRRLGKYANSTISSRVIGLWHYRQVNSQQQSGKVQLYPWLSGQDMRQNMTDLQPGLAVTGESVKVLSRPPVYRQRD